MKKKTSISMLREKIREMVREEIKLSLKEEASPQFDKIRDKQKFIDWVMRQYFDPQKHKGKIWYSPDVTEDNVLDYVTKSAAKGIFPSSPKNLVSLYSLKKQLHKSMGKMETEEEKLQRAAAKAEEDEDKATYQTGEVSLKDIGAELGGVTPTMINKLAATAGEKFKKLTGGKHPAKLNSEELEEVLEKIYKARIEAAEEVAAMLKAAPSVDAYLQGLLKMHILSPTDLKIVSKEEVDGLEYLMTMDVNRIKMILLQDIQEDENIFKSYQAVVSKKVFPPGKRGRPRKQ